MEILGNLLNVLWLFAVINYLLGLWSQKELDALRFSHELSKEHFIRIMRLTVRVRRYRYLALTHVVLFILGLLIYASISLWKVIYA